MSYYNNSEDTGFANASLNISAILRVSTFRNFICEERINAVLVDAVVVSGSPENEPLTKTEENKKAS